MNRWLLNLAVLLFVTPLANSQSHKALEIVPEGALGFMIVNNMQQLSDKIESLAKKVKTPAHTSFLESLRQMGPKKGLDAKGSALIIAVRAKDPKDVLSVVVDLPASNMTTLLKELDVKDDREIMHGQVGIPDVFASLSSKPDKKEEKPKFPVLIAKKNDFVLIAPSMGALVNEKGKTTADAEHGLRQVLDSRKSIAGSLKQAQGWLDEMDVAGVVSKTGLQFGIGMFGAGVGTSTPAEFEGLKTFYADIEKNVTVLAFGAQQNNEGDWRLSARAYFQADGEFARWMAKAEPLQADLLSHVVANRFLAAASVRLSGQVALERLAKLAVPKESTDDCVRFLRHVDEVSFFVDPSGKLPVILARVDDTAAFMQSAERLHKKVENDSGATFDHRVIDGRQAVIITVPPPKDDKKRKDDNKNEAASYWLLGALDKKTVVLVELIGIAKADLAQAAMEKLTKTSDHSILSNPNLRKTMAKLPGKKQVEICVDLRSALLLGGVWGEGFKLQECPPLGFAVLV